MIEIKDLTFSYKRDQKLFNALRLSILPGGIYGLLGKNGAGKSTLLKLIAGLQYPKEGEISIKGISSLGRTPEYLKQYFYIAEEFNLPAIKIDSYLNIYAPFYKDFDKKAFQTYLDEFKIPRENRLNKMSYGQKKKFLLSFGLACNSEILFMDEPTNGLDIPSKSTFRKLIANNITDNRIFIISTHQIKDIEGMIDTVIILDEGQIMFNQNIERISRKLVFKTLSEQTNTEDIIFSEDHIIHKRAILTNKTQEDSPIDIELLFNAVISDNQKLTQQFKH